MAAFAGGMGYAAISAMGTQRKGSAGGRAGSIGSAAKKWIRTLVCGSSCSVTR